MLNFVCRYFLMFVVYSVIGYLVEITSVSIRTKKLTFSRGFLLGPYLPIYGRSAVLLILCFSNHNINIFEEFILCLFICTFIEYITSYIMEKLFKVRWWDYSNRLFNIKGRICLSNSLLFGLGGTFILRVLNPLISPLVYSIKLNYLYIITFILFIIILTDDIISILVLNKLKNKFIKLSGARDSTSDIKKQVLDTLCSSNFLTRRTLKAYPRVNNLYLGSISDIKDRFDKKINKIKEDLTKDL